MTAFQDKPKIAVVGMAGVFPGASDLSTFWSNLLHNTQSVAEVVPNRWIAPLREMTAAGYVPDKTFSKRAALINDFVFDPNGFSLPADLLADLDPSHHLALHAAREALAGCLPDSVDRNRVGTILAAIALPTEGASAITRKLFEASFAHRLFHRPESARITRPEAMASRVCGLPASIVARALDLGGGSFTLDAACASSLYAVKLACDHLGAFRADVMIAGGVSRPECLYTQVGFSQLRALSASGRCAPFDVSADGLVVGEGAGILVLKRLEDALAHKDTVYGVIGGIGLSNDMGGNLLAPESRGQLRAMEHAYAQAGWSPDWVDFIECHGAGTPVGDATELRSLAALWDEAGCNTGSCALGSVKSNIGHLLTAAGAAGMIKTLLAIHHKTLPPSANFTRPAKGSMLAKGPFHVQTKPEPWLRRRSGTPRRAAVSAFGFGGINAHLLFEQLLQTPPSARGADTCQTVEISKKENPLPKPVAIVGMGACFGDLDGLKSFQKAVFQAETACLPPPVHRWHGLDTDAALAGLPGRYLVEVRIDTGAFHIPPKEIPDILPQQLLMLRVAAAAMKDANLVLGQKRPGVGTVIGIDFDFEATNFHFRWHLANLARKWSRDMNRPDIQCDTWLSALRDAAGPPLTAPRTLGALGGIVASRIAKQFGFGGPSFVVSGEEAAGLRALEIAVRAIQQEEVDAMLVGAVDLSGDLRNIVSGACLRPFSPTGRNRPFDRGADGALAGDGAGALVLKTLDRAVADGDRIYAVIGGIGTASGGGIDTGVPSRAAYVRSLQAALADARVAPGSVSLVQAHGSGDPVQDQMEIQALQQVFGGHGQDCALSSIKPVTGHVGAASGLGSVIAAALSLYQETIPPLAGFVNPIPAVGEATAFHLPAAAQYWARNRIEGPRRACAAAMTWDGNCGHVIMEGFEPDGAAIVSPKIAAERRQPTGGHPAGLFLVPGDNPGQLLFGLKALRAHLSETGSGFNPSPGMESAARLWHAKTGMQADKTTCVAVAGADASRIQVAIAAAEMAVAADQTLAMDARGAAYCPEPLGPKGQLSFVFPGSGNHFVGMGKAVGTRFPEVLRDMDRATDELKTQLIPSCYMPWRRDWIPGWEAEALAKIESDPLHMIFGQVLYAGLMTNLMASVGLRPDAAISYSLGESAGYFALGAWPERGEMLSRMKATELFTTILAGDCTAARKVWKVPETQPVNWTVAVVNRPADEVRSVLPRWPTARLLIVNTQQECVIGGMGSDVNGAIGDLGVEALFLKGVVTVHCEAAAPAKDAYRRLHLFPTRAPAGIRFYSGYHAKAIELTTDSAADSILGQALHGFDFPATIRQAYGDGVRLFVEMGPHSSCTRMIGRILSDKPHVAVSASQRGEDEVFTVLKCLATLAAHRVPLDLTALYGTPRCPEISNPDAQRPKSEIAVPVGGLPIDPHLPLLPAPETITAKTLPAGTPVPEPVALKSPSPEVSPAFKQTGLFEDMLADFNTQTRATALAHESYLAFSQDLTRSYADAFSLQTRLLEQVITGPTASPMPPLNADLPARPPAPRFDRDMCLEFATGSAARVLGPEFAELDGYPVRVRLPDEPLMLVDRILSVHGKKGSLTSGRVVTEHDVLPNAWYLDGDRAPVCISVEAGQADLFLCAWLGIDLAVQGTRAYRLLDAKVVFHRGLPRPGEVIRYDIEIKRFIRQGQTWMFFFHFEGTIGNQPLITMTDGCAGFFTEVEVEASGGILETEKDRRAVSGKAPVSWPLVPMVRESFDRQAVDALRGGDLPSCFGPDFDGLMLPESQRLPGGRMHLVDRVLELDPRGGRWQLGAIRAQADIKPDDWFLTCHFVDDPVMPGTLMYECCAHTLRIFLQRAGWITGSADSCWEPVIGVTSVLKCRGPVTPKTRRVDYEVQIREIGYAPEPYVIADAHMYADGRYIVMFQDMSMKLSGTDIDALQRFWKSHRAAAPAKSHRVSTAPALFDRGQLLAFCTGNPSSCFGAPYRVFDNQRRIARLPRPPYFFMDRVTHAQPPPWVLAPGGWITAEYDLRPDAWYFRADRSDRLAFCILLEIALQPCGFLAAYLGSALTSETDLKFRNLGGKATVFYPLAPDAGTLTMKARLTQVSAAGSMIIENFDMQVLQKNTVVYQGETSFGFFTDQALSDQKGIRDAEKWAYVPSGGEQARSQSADFAEDAPLFPDDPAMTPAPPLAMPAKALRMIDRIALWIPDGGPAGLGFVRGIKQVDASEWFFDAHFYQDPVCPGSLGIESFIQLIKFAALCRWRHLESTHRFEMITDSPHSWTYRGQILPSHKEVVVEAVITRVQDHCPKIFADGLLKVDGLCIYRMQDFGLQLVPISS